MRIYYNDFIQSLIVLKHFLSSKYYRNKNVSTQHYRHPQDLYGFQCGFADFGNVASSKADTSPRSSTAIVVQIFDVGH